ncbi:hypothetical protein [Microbacterium foliorum]|uniref:hypothetical protein n=1 Tax=Microbacterium foliorum TaxID=104336 RepID=UPI0028D5624D|nr:hypothetical protein [Microbacterium foliorum]
MSRSRLRPSMCAVLALGAITLLSGCMNAPTVDVLASGESAPLPASVGADQRDSVVPDTARLLGEDSEGHTYYVVEAREQTGLGSICLVIDGVDHGPMMGCGAMPIEVGTDGVRARLSVEVTPEQSGEKSGEKIGEYLRVFL